MGITLSWGIVGAGDIAHKISAQTMKEANGSQLVAVMRTDLDRARQFASDFGVPRFYASAKELIDDPDINAVYVATPVNLHCEHTIMAAQAGKHVLVEKPMALDAHECEAMINACEKHGVQLMVLFYQRFNRLHQELQQLVASGTLGRVAAARSNFTQLSAKGPISPKWVWRLDPKQSGGGTLMDTGSHCVDTLRFVLRTEVKRVGALSSRILFDYPVEDTTSAVLEFEGGTQAVVTSYWSSPDWVPSLVNRLEIYGENGFAHTSPVNDKQSHGEMVWNTGNGLNTFTGQQQNTHITAIEEFRASIEAGTLPPVTGVDGWLNARILSAIYQSAREGKFISLS